VTAAAHASLGGMPMLMITGQKPVLQSRQAQLAARVAAFLFGCMSAIGP
jgi:thiamine pyrophosphate-dependent acetolactate synthase large subunit-like protein